MEVRITWRFSLFIPLCWMFSLHPLTLPPKILTLYGKTRTILPGGRQASNKTIMKKGIHPGNYRLVVFKDMSNGHSFLSRSTAPSKETVKWEDGNEYPLVKLEISNTSHPFFTGKNVLVDTAGRIDKFKKKYEKKK
jgi:large subunit ribosomal protein L31